MKIMIDSSGVSGKMKEGVERIKQKADEMNEAIAEKQAVVAMEKVTEALFIAAKIAQRDYPNFPAFHKESSEGSWLEWIRTQLEWVLVFVEGGEKK